LDGHLILIGGVAIVVAAICRSRDIPAPLPLIGTGLILDLIAPTTAQTLINPEVVLTLILAPVVFAAGLGSSAVDLRQIRRGVLLLAVGLVVITTLAIGVVTTAIVAAMPLAVAFALGAVLGPTDAVAAGSVAKRGGLPRGVTLLIEGESLANDATALTILRVAIVAAVAGSVTFVESSEILFAAVVFGVLVGTGGGLVISWFVRITPEPVVANAILFLTPFGLFELAEFLEGSGLLALVIAGVWISHATGFTAGYRTRLQAVSVWSLITFLLESVAFVLVGVELIATSQGPDSPGPVRIAILAVILTVTIIGIRGLFMAGWFALGPRFAPSAFTERRSTAKQFLALSLLGVRGPISVLAVFSIPLTLASGDPFPERNLIMSVTFGVVVLSLLSSLAAGPLIARLNLNSETEAQQLRNAQVAVAKAALRRLDELIVQADDDGRPLPEGVVARLRSVASRRLDQVSRDEQKAAAAADKTKIVRNLQRSMLHAERRELERLRSQHRAPGDVVRQLSNELDVREAALA